MGGGIYRKMVVGFEEENLNSNGLKRGLKRARNRAGGAGWIRARLTGMLAATPGPTRHCLPGRAKHGPEFLVLGRAVLRASIRASGPGFHSTSLWYEN